VPEGTAKEDAHTPALPEVSEGSNVDCEQKFTHKKDMIMETDCGCSIVRGKNRHVLRRNQSHPVDLSVPPVRYFGRSSSARKEAVNPGGCPIYSPLAPARARSSVWAICPVSRRHRPQRGFRVAPITAEDVRDLTEAGLTWK
jgi:hypothetical protein